MRFHTMADRQHGRDACDSCGQSVYFRREARPLRGQQNGRAMAGPPQGTWSTGTWSAPSAQSPMGRYGNTGMGLHRKGAPPSSMSSPICKKVGDVRGRTLRAGLGSTTGSGANLCILDLAGRFLFPQGLWLSSRPRMTTRYRYGSSRRWWLSTISASVRWPHGGLR